MTTILVAVMLSATGPTKIVGRDVCDLTTFQLSEQWNIGQSVSFKGFVTDVKPMSDNFAIVQVKLITYESLCDLTAALVVKKSYARTVEMWAQIDMRSVFFLNLESDYKEVPRGRYANHILVLTNSKRMLQDYRAHGS